LPFCIIKLSSGIFSRDPLLLLLRYLYVVSSFIPLRLITIRLSYVNGVLMYYVKVMHCAIAWSVLALLRRQLRFAGLLIRSNQPIRE
jgi:hypothetical protein